MASKLILNKVYTPLLAVNKNTETHTSIIGASNYVGRVEAAVNPSTTGQINFNKIGSNDKTQLMSKKCFLKFTYKVTFTGTSTSGNLIQTGLDAPRCFPIHSCIQSCRLNINGKAVSINHIADSIHPRSRYFDLSKFSKNDSSSYWFPDLYQDFHDGYMAIDSSLNGCTNTPLGNKNPRGAIVDLVVDQNDANTAIIHFTSYEPLMFAPFQHDDMNDEPLFNIQTMDVQLQMQTPERIWTHDNNKTNISNMNVQIENAELHYFTATLPNGLSVPEHCIAPYYDYDIQSYQIQTILAASASTNITTSNYQLGRCPSSIYIWAAPERFSGNVASIINQSDTYANISHIEINYAGKSSILSDLSEEQIYESLCVPNGINYNYAAYHGTICSDLSGATKIGLTGSVIRIRPGVGGFSDGYDLVAGVEKHSNLQIKLTVKNPSNTQKVYNVYALFVYEGIMDIMSDGQVNTDTVMFNNVQELIDAPVSSLSFQDLEMLGGGLFDKIKNFLGNSKIISGVADVASKFGVPGASTISNVASTLGFGRKKGSAKAAGFNGGATAAGFNGGRILDPAKLYD